VGDSQKQLIVMSLEEQLPPNYQKLDLALRSIGYSFETAVADVIDNSVDAQAKHVLVRLIVTCDGHLDLAIWDDGTGMNELTLKEAMRFGADVSQEIQRLGKFGLGLKLASLSQAREVRVISILDDQPSGRAWTEHGIARGFTNTIFDVTECVDLLARTVAEHRAAPSGTLVWWSRLYRVGHHRNLEEHAQKLMRRLETYLSLAFHRFLSGRPRQVNITLDIFDQKSGKFGIPIALDALDPFGYERSAKDGFPATMSLEGHYYDRFSIKAHIWPANSTAPEYKLPGGANSRQGFYFYRHNRLIQGGGWNGLREVEPHSSLARLEVDIAADFDIEVSLDVKKVEIHLPPDLMSAIQKAKTSSGIDFKSYLSLANEAYRKRSATHSELPLIPSIGLPAGLTQFLHQELRLKSTAKHRDLKIKWKPLDESEFFDIDRDAGYLYINRLYRRRLLHGLSASAADLPVLKCLLFLVLEDALGSERMGSKIRDRLDQVKYNPCPCRPI
jgi:Histidine kinase-, DNA gyrase B-, and HSP90-like ATPase